MREFTSYDIVEKPEGVYYICYLDNRIKVGDAKEWPPQEVLLNGKPTTVAKFEPFNNAFDSNPDYLTSNIALFVKQ